MSIPQIVLFPPKILFTFSMVAPKRENEDNVALNVQIKRSLIFPPSFFQSTRIRCAHHVHTCTLQVA